MIQRFSGFFSQSAEKKIRIIFVLHFVAEKNAGKKKRCLNDHSIPYMELRNIPPNWWHS